jgi:hypothetical protein
MISEDIAVIENSAPIPPLDRKARWQQNAVGFALKEGLCLSTTFVSSLIGLPFLQHNMLLEFGLIASTAIVSEAVGHRIFDCKQEKESKLAAMKRYGVSLAFGFATWPVHHVIFHNDGHEGHDSDQHEEHHHGPECYEEYTSFVYRMEI